VRKEGKDKANKERRGTEAKREMEPERGWKRKQVAEVLTTKGRIAAANYRITLASAGYSLYFTKSQRMPPPEIAPFPRGILAAT